MITMLLLTHGTQIIYITLLDGSLNGMYTNLIK